MRVGQDFDQNCARVGATMNFVDGIPPLRIDRGARQEFSGMGLRGLEDIVVADEKVGVCLIVAPVVVIGAVHAEQHGLVDVA